MARILIVEDNAHQASLLSMWLRKNRHEVEVASNGADAQARLQADDRAEDGRCIDILISDVNMPEMTGIELVRWVRHERGLDIPILILSSRCDQADLAGELGSQSVRIFAKPFSPSRLVAEIENILTRRTCGEDATRC
ncbi:MAG: response regulator transcription factor [Phycisphaerae bacterium]|nr:response regulator transcription factor [Phycisphaerae bacterium]